MFRPPPNDALQLARGGWVGRPGWQVYEGIPWLAAWLGAQQNLDVRQRVPRLLE